jgi:hypothetical protein
MDKNTEPEDIDYMHPQGKPNSRDGRSAPEKKFDGRELEAESKREKNSLIDTDGHHICSAECKKHRLVDC